MSLIYDKWEITNTQRRTKHDEINGAEIMNLHFEGRKRHHFRS